MLPILLLFQRLFKKYIERIKIPNVTNITVIPRAVKKIRYLRISALYQASYVEYLKKHYSFRLNYQKFLFVHCTNFSA